MQQVWNDKSQEAGDTRQPPKMWAFKNNIVKPYFDLENPFFISSVMYFTLWQFVKISW